MRYTSIMVLSFLLLISCASKDFNEPGQLPATEEANDRTFKGSYAEIWTAALSALEKKKYPLSSTQKSSGVIITDWVMGKSDRLFSGFGETRIPYSIRSKFTLELHPSRSGVHIKVSNTEQYLSDAVTAGTDFSGTLYQWVPTESSNAKEAELLNEIDAQLESAKKPK